MTEIEQQARELLASVMSGGQLSHFNVNRPVDVTEAQALTAIAAALRAAPEGFALVDLDDNSVLPDTPTQRMLDAAWPDHEFIDRTFDKQGAYADLLAAARKPVTLSTVTPPRDLRTKLGDA